MSAAQLEATFEAHKVPILATVGAGVAVLAFMRRKSAASSGDPAAATTSYATGGQLANTGGSGGAPYDSTSTDLASFLSPQLGSIASQLSDLQNAQNAQNPIPVPAPTPAPAPAPPKVLPGPVKPYTPPTPAAFHPVVKPAPAHKVDTWVTVLRGQTLTGIAAKYGASITPTTIARGNGIADPNKIYAGQRLHIVG